MSDIRSISYTKNTYGNIKDFYHLKKSSEKIKIGETFNKKTTYYCTDGVPTEFIRPQNIVCANNNIKKSNLDIKNQVNFANSDLVLGNYNDETIVLKNYGGSLISPFSVPVEFASNPGQHATPYEMKSAELARKIPPKEFDEICTCCNALNRFAKVSAGKETINTIPKSVQDELKTALEKLGVDISKPFAINGEEYYVKDNGNIGYLNMKKYVKREDGKIEIHDVPNFKIENDRVIEL